MLNIIPELKSLPAQAILDALSEYQQLGEDAFLNRYHPYKPATVHFGYHGDLRFPPRAILAAAYSKFHGRIPEPDEGIRQLSAEQLVEIYIQHGMRVAAEATGENESVGSKTVLRIEDPESVLKAMREFDELGRDGFLAKYGYGKARSYFILKGNRLYDSKAIAGVARGYDRPDLGVLTNNQFSGGQNGVVPRLMRLGFTVIKEPPGRLESPLVLVQNDQTEGSKFDFYEDTTGEVYHYPNKYRNLVKPGRRFIYYRGARKADGSRRVPEYFGWGVIGEVTQDPETIEAEKSSRRWICEIEEYVPFDEPVPFKVDGQEIEDIPQNLRGVGVREISDDIFEQILSLAGHKAEAIGESAQPRFPAIEPMKIQTAPGSLMRPVKKNGSKQRSNWSESRHSKISKDVGDRGEEIVLEYLKQQLTAKERESLRWIAQEGEKPGWDIEYRSGGKTIAVEVKATVGSVFPSVELTAREWLAAEEHRGNFVLALVTKARFDSPVVELIRDPWGEVEKSRLDASALTWRLVRVKT